MKNKFLYEIESIVDFHGIYSNSTHSLQGVASCVYGEVRRMDDIKPITQATQNWPQSWSVLSRL